MPIYAYRCAVCGHAKDVLRKISDPVLTLCPACGAAAFQKQVTAAGFQLKGSGWYVTDFRGDSKGGKEAKDGKVEQPSSAAADASTGGKEASAPATSAAASGSTAAAATPVSVKPSPAGASGSSGSGSAGSSGSGAGGQ